MSDVRHEDGTNLVSDGAEPRKIVGARVDRSTAPQSIMAGRKINACLRNSSHSMMPVSGRTLYGRDSK